MDWAANIHLPGYEKETGSRYFIKMIPMNATQNVDLYQSIELNLGLTMELPLAAAVSGFGRRFAGAKSAD